VVPPEPQPTNSHPTESPSPSESPSNSQTPEPTIPSSTQNPTTSQIQTTVSVPSSTTHIITSTKPTKPTSNPPLNTQKPVVSPTKSSLIFNIITNSPTNSLATDAIGDFATNLTPTNNANNSSHGFIPNSSIPSPKNVGSMEDSTSSNSSFIIGMIFIGMLSLVALAFGFIYFKRIRRQKSVAKFAAARHLKSARTARARSEYGTNRQSVLTTTRSFPTMLHNEYPMPVPQNAQVNSNSDYLYRNNNEYEDLTSYPMGGGYTSNRNGINEYNNDLCYGNNVNYAQQYQDNSNNLYYQPTYTNDNQNGNTYLYDDLNHKNVNNQFHNQNEVQNSSDYFQHYGSETPNNNYPVNLYQNPSIYLPTVQSGSTIIQYNNKNAQLPDNYAEVGALGTMEMDKGVMRQNEKLFYGSEILNEIDTQDETHSKVRNGEKEITNEIESEVLKNYFHGQ
ncbi:hypothetical protein HK099_002329, partial [Clydaea vesicula]